MAPEARRIVSQPGEASALAHPLRLDLLNHLMSSGPATASQCARAVGDTASNCSYHLRYLARHGLVEPARADRPQDPTDQRERPWRATITGFGVDADQLDPRAESALATIALQRDQRLARDYLARRDTVGADWRAAGEMATYTLRTNPAELTDLIARLDALIRPYIAATRTDADGDASLVHLGLHAFVLDAER
jgi:DNA-binding transcriptional ArsR family regulator